MSKIKDAVKRARSEINKSRKNLNTLCGAYSQLQVFYAAA